VNQQTHLSQGSARPLAAGDIAGFVRDVLLDPARDYPVVATTTQPRGGQSLIDPDLLARELRGLADVIALETGDATWALSELLPPRLDVYGGAARIWWPGLTMASDPYDHRLYFVHSAAEAERVLRQIIGAVKHAGVEPAPPPQPGSPPPAMPAITRAQEPPERATVTAIKPGRIEVRTPSRSGTVIEADLPINIIAECLAPGDALDVQPLRPQGDGTWAYSLTGLLPSTWEIARDEVRVGEVLTGRVQNVLPEKGLVFVDLLPGVVGICHIRELDYRRVDDMTEYCSSGDLLPFRILDIDAAAMRLQLSLKQAYGDQARPSPSLVPGGKPFVWKSGMPMFESLRRRREGDRSPLRTLARPSRPAAGPGPDVTERIEALTAELEAASDERANLVSQVRELRQQVTQHKKDLRAAEDRYDALARRSAGELDPLSSERAFLLAIRLAYARMFEEHDRLEHPLRRMRIGPSFLRAVRELSGISIEKIVEVCTQVGCGIAPSIPAREVHQLRDGPRGAGNRTRASDGAKAWRCSLQDNTASARRLHWWSIPGENGGVIELASVVLHDDFSIPD
jgi:predicted RNA-binding protein with RPS1 domain